MATLNWQNTGTSSPTETSATFVNPWFGISMGLIGLIIGFALHRFIIPTTLSAQVLQQPTTQAVVVQPSPTKPLPSAGGGCGGGCGGGGGGCGVVAPAPSPT